MKEQVDHPEHYNNHPSGIECIDVIRHMKFNIGNAIKYLWRQGLKTGEASEKELSKAQWYIEDEINEKKQKYVLGFCFSLQLDQVLLIKKNKPDRQIGLYNGIGGKINKNERPTNAMIREFKEETGLSSSVWIPFFKLSGPDYVVECFWTHIEYINNYQSPTDEKVELFNVNNLPHNIISNLSFLIPMAIHAANGADINGKLNYK